MTFIVYIFALLIISVFSCRQIMKYNTRYSISKPHYLCIYGPVHNDPKNIPKIDTSYHIPKEIYKKVFRENIAYKNRY